MTLRIEHVENIPDDLAEGVLYISEKYKTAIHKCPCGCGCQVVTPTSGEYAWQLSGDAGVASLTPSIGNWNFACRSHYYITENVVRWC